MKKTPQNIKTFKIGFKKYKINNFFYKNYIDINCFFIYNKINKIYKIFY